MLNATKLDKKDVNYRVMIIIILSILLLAIIAIIAIGVGSVFIEPKKVLEVIFGKVDTTDVEYIIVKNMRFTRVIAGIFGGAALSLSGLLLQVLFRNPIADPYILGISSGARLSVGLMLLAGVNLGFSTTNAWLMFAQAFAGSLIALIIILAFAKKIKNITTLLIVGMMIGYLCSAIVGLLVAFSDDTRIADFTRWTMGSFGMMTWDKIVVLVVVTIVFMMLSFTLSKGLNALLLGEDYAKTMGVNINLLRFLIILFAGILTGVVTAFAGMISFIGMSVPHIARMLLKTNDNRILIPVTAIFGAIFGVTSDLIARTIAAPNELAVGTITSFIGVPIVLFLLLKKNKV